MKKIVYNKLVRDYIPEVLKNDLNVIKFKTRIADDKEYGDRLLDKLEEEVHEFIQNPSAEEMSDIIEVLEHLKEFHNIETDALRIEKKKKKLQRGGFSKKIVLEWVKEKVK